MKLQNLALIAFFSCISCASSGKWEGADELVSQLACGLSPEQVNEICATFDGLKVSDSKLGPPGNLVASKDGTRITFSIRDSRLEGYDIAWADGFMYVSSQPYVALCPDDNQENQ